MSEIQLPPPNSWKEFENLCFQLFKKEWNDPFIQRNGREGEVQNGVDIFGNLDNLSIGIQCKGKNIYPQANLTKSEILIEIEKAKKFNPALKNFIIITTAPRNSKLQEFVRLQSKELENQGFFKLFLFFWHDINERLAIHFDLIRTFYPFYFTYETEAITQIKEGTEELKVDSGLIIQSVNEIKLALSSTVFAKLDSDQIDHKAEIEYAKQLIKSHKPETALEYLKTLHDKKWDIASNISKYHILRTMGSSLYRMGKFSEAADKFIEAFDYNREDEKANSNLALAFSIKQQNDKCLEVTEKIIHQNKSNVEAYSLRIANESIETKDKIKKIPKQIINESEILHAIAFSFLKEKNYLQAEKFFELAVKNDKVGIPDFKANLASCKLEVIDNKDVIKKEINTAQALKEIVILLTEAIETLKNTEEIKYKYSWIINRGLAKKIKGDIKGAEDDFLLALEYNPDDRIAKIDFAVLKFEKNHKEGIEFLEELVNSDNSIQAKLLLADFYRIDKLFVEAESLLDVLSLDELNDKHRESYFRIKESIYFEQGLQEKVQEISAKRLEERPQDIIARVDSAIRSMKNNNSQLATAKLLESISYLEDNTPLYERKLLSEALYHNKLYAEAIGVFETFVNKDEKNDQSKMLLDSYYKTRKWDKALDLCTQLRKSDDKDAKLLDMETYIYEQMGNLEKACLIYEEYLKKYNDISVLTKLGFLYYKARYGSKLNNLLKSNITHKDLTFEEKIQLAYLFSVSEYNQLFRDLVYDLRRNYFNISKAHSTYIWLFLERGSKDLDLLDPKTVTNNTVVFLKMGNETKYYILDDIESADLSKREINSQSELYKKLLNHVAGDNVELFSNDYTSEIWEITQIKSKYIHALHESMINFNEQFPQDKSLQKVTFDPSDISKTLTLLAKDSEKRKHGFKEFLNFYKDGKITIGMLAKNMHNNIIEIWGYLTQDEKIGLINKNSKGSEKESFSLDAPHKQNIVIDLTAIITLVSCDVNLKKLKNSLRFLVCQHSVDEINALIEEKSKFKSNAGFTIFSEEEKLYRQDITAESRENELMYLNGLLNFIKDYCRVEPIIASTISEFENYDEIREVMDSSSLFSVLLAKQTNAILYSDDQMLRNLAFTEECIQGIWTQYFLQKLYHNNFLSLEEYNQKIGILVELNYRHTSISAETLVQSFKDSNWLLSNRNQKLFNILRGLNCDDNSAIVVSVNFVFELWHAIVSSEKRDSIFVDLVNNLMVNRNISFLNKLVLAIDMKFNLLPIQAKEIKTLLGVIVKSQKYLY